MTSLKYEDHIDMLPSGNQGRGEDCRRGTTSGSEGVLASTAAGDAKPLPPCRCSVRNTGNGSAVGRTGSKEDRKSSKQKKIKMAVIVVTLVLVMTSVILVGVTLSMSGHIDDMVRQKQDGISSTPKPQNAVGGRGR